MFRVCYLRCWVIGVVRVAGVEGALACLGPSEGDLRDRKRVPNVLKLDSSAD